MAYSSDSFRDYAMEVEGESSAVVVADPIGICPSDAGSRTERIPESLLTKVTDLSQGQHSTAVALNELGLTQEEISNRLTSLEQFRSFSRYSGSRRASKQNSR